MDLLKLFSIFQYLFDISTYFFFDLYFPSNIDVQLQYINFIKNVLIDTQSHQNHGAVAHING